MSEFLTTHKVYLTPISPIHIGCGEDFEPTNYVIDDGVLYHFEPSNLSLDKTKRQELLNHSNRMDLLAIQRFFLTNKATAMAQSHYFSNVSLGIAQIYQQRIGKVAQRESNGNEVIAKLAIERTAYQPYSGLPYVPASGVKGALMMAFLDQKHQAKQNPKIAEPKKEAKKLTQAYIGEFAESVGRFIRFGDFVPQSAVQSKVYFAVNYKKIVPKSGDTAKGIPLRRETITQGQYRAFASELALQEKTVKDIPISKKTLIAALNRFYLPVFKKELALLSERGLVERSWANSVISLVENQHIALIRLGKNGADSKIYQGENVAQIKIMKGKGNKPDYKDRATTVWLAAENDKSTASLLPFGWAILEFDSDSENPTLKQWCDVQPKSQFDRNAIIAKREAEQAEKARLKAEEEAKQQAKLEAEKAKANLLNSLSGNQRLIMDFVEKLNNTTERQADNTGSPLLKEAEALILQAAEWELTDRQFVFEQLTVEYLKSKIDFRKKDTEKNVKKWRNKLGIA